MPTIAIVGSTGAQGGSVINQLLKTGAWKIRALTRNASSESAKALAAKVCTALYLPTLDLESESLLTRHRASRSSPPTSTTKLAS